MDGRAITIRPTERTAKGRGSRSVGKGGGEEGRRRDRGEGRGGRRLWGDGYESCESCYVGEGSGEGEEGGGRGTGRGERGKKVGGIGVHVKRRNRKRTDGEQAPWKSYISFFSKQKRHQ